MAGPLQNEDKVLNNFGTHHLLVGYFIFKPNWLL